MSEQSDKPDEDAVAIARVLVEQHDPIGQNEVFILAREILRLSIAPSSTAAATKWRFGYRWCDACGCKCQSSRCLREDACGQILEGGTPQQPHFAAEAAAINQTLRSLSPSATASASTALMVLSIVFMLLEDVAEKPERLKRAQEIATRDITPLLRESSSTVATEAAACLQMMLDNLGHDSELDGVGVERVENCIKALKQ